MVQHDDSTQMMHAKKTGQCVATSDCTIDATVIYRMSNNRHVLNDKRSSRAQFSSGARMRVYRSRYSTCSNLEPAALGLPSCLSSRPGELVQKRVTARKCECRRRLYLLPYLL